MCSLQSRNTLFKKGYKKEFDTSKFTVAVISIDTNYKAWKRASKSENIDFQKHNYIISNWKESTLYHKYKINSIPRYILFGQNGKIIDEYAPKPSSEALKTLISKNIN